MARTDAIVLGAGIVGVSVALHLARRGLSVALIDRAGLGEQTSYGNAGIIEGNTIFPPAFPSNLPARWRASRSNARAKPIIICHSCRMLCLGCWLPGRIAARSTC